jgi:hypothetical protein
LGLQLAAKARARGETGFFRELPIFHCLSLLLERYLEHVQELVGVVLSYIVLVHFFRVRKMVESKAFVTGTTEAAFSSSFKKESRYNELLKKPQNNGSTGDRTL